MPPRRRTFAAERAFLRVYARTTAAPAAGEAAPLFAVAIVVTAIFFGPNGMRAPDIIVFARDSPEVRATLLGAWLLVVAPAARVLVRGPGARTLRTLPVDTNVFALAQLLALVAMHAPWIALWTLGASPLSAVAWVLGALALVTCSTAGGVRAPAWGLAAALAVVLVATPTAPRGSAFALSALLSSALAAMTYALGVRDAWVRGLVTPARGPRVPLRRAPVVVALALAQFALVVRGNGVRILRTFALAACGGVAGAICARAYELGDGPRAHVLGVAVILPVAAGVAATAPPIARGEFALSWLVRTTGRSLLTLHLASRLASHAFAFAGGVVACVAARELVHAPVVLTWALASNACGSALFRAAAPHASLHATVRVAAFLAVVIIGFASWGGAVLWAVVALACLAEIVFARDAARAGSAT
jgi:hypothetical protein